MSSRTVRATQRNPVSKNKNKNKSKQTKQKQDHSFQAESGNQAWWHKLVILMPGREDCEFKVCLDYVVGLCSRNKTSVVDRTDFEVRLVAQELLLVSSLMKCRWLRQKDHCECEASLCYVVRPASEDAGG